MDCFPWENEQPQLHLDYSGGLISIKVKPSAVFHSHRRGWEVASSRHSQRRKRPATLGGEQGGRQGGHGGTASDGNFDETLVESVDTGRRQ